MTAVRDEIGEDASASSLVSDAQIVRLLNIGQRKICLEGNFLPTCHTASTVASQEVYSVPTDFLKVTAVFLNGTTKRKLKPIAVTERDPKGGPGTPKYYYLWGRNVSGAFSYVVGLNPIPSTSGTSDLAIYTTQQPLTMVNGGQAPEIPVPFQDALIAYACWKVYARDHTASMGLADRYKREWQEWVQLARDYHDPNEDTPRLIQDTAGYLVSWV